ncbi:hypothetical protein FHS60_002180 [Alloprevotella rava]|uniref:Uncharacterized protein n=1 Tax=Alloprevotella rava TaxID=671218 RepID=A0A7W5UG68_9BACT|nr:hypothetical protein [Alloprevotella rava]
MDIWQAEMVMCPQRTVNVHKFSKALSGVSPFS